MAVTNLDPLDIWRSALVANVRRDAPDLSARQMAVLLTVYMTEPPHTVRGLAEILNVSKPAITRAIDRLGEFGLARRKTDPRDRRSIVVQRTVKGSVYLAEFAEIIGVAAKERARARASEQARREKAAAAKPAQPAAAKQPGSKAPAASAKEPASS